MAVAHLSLWKNTCVAESFPARISVSQEVTMDVCRGKTEHALRSILKSVHDFFDAWASFQIQLDKAENGGLNFLSCNYKLRLPVSPEAGLESKAGKVLQGKENDAWIRPTAQMCKSWGYEKKEGKTWRPATNETVIIVSEKSGP